MLTSFTSFRLFTHLGVKQMHYDWGQAAAKKERGCFEQRTSSKEGSAVQL